MIKVLLSLDLIDSEDKRDEFYELLRDENWFKTNDVDTVWTLNFPNRDPENDEDYKGVRDRIANVLIKAATDLKLKKIYYVAQLGNHEFIARQISKVDGQYKCTRRSLYPE
ncbi:hypothetical protein [Pseudomonas sp. 8 R 14]|uniref:hypothetical protein n=1 Tax=Pseudomonas sp. 8 R 14 TaxID=1844092 RepID=UPI00081230F9|nr:hypothetical protein [Pseudomonas sp. 8 R 14]CRM19117.1 hypothetical protein [Pseudomonas sp. 8 R 14]